MNHRLSAALARAQAWTYLDRTLEFSGFKFDSVEKAIEAIIGRFVFSWTIETPKVERSHELHGIEAVLITVYRNGASHTVEAFVEFDRIDKYSFEIMEAEKLSREPLF